MGRDQHGLFLVLHCDDVHMGLQSHLEVIAALKELYPAPGGGGGLGNSASSAGSSLVGGVGLAGVGEAVASHNTFTLQNHRLIRQQRTVHLLNVANPTTATNTATQCYLFQAPHAEAILDKIVRIVKNQGDLIVWGTQELLAECGECSCIETMFYWPDFLAFVFTAGSKFIFFVTHHPLNRRCHRNLLA